jgi:hypothetical protein
MFLIDRVLGSRPAWLRWLIYAAALSFGVWDITSELWFSEHTLNVQANIAKEFKADKEFYAQIEQRIPDGAVFTLPHIQYPEQVVGKIAYEHARGYLLTNTVRWSYGAMKWREIDQWQSEVACAPTAEMLGRITYRGFDGLYIDRRGYNTPAEADKVISDIQSQLGSDIRPLTHSDGNQLFFDIRTFKEKLRSKMGQAAYDAAARAEADTVRVIWLKGFFPGAIEPSSIQRVRLCQSEAQAVIINPTDTPKTLHMFLIYRSYNAEPSDLEIIGGSLWSERFPITTFYPDPKEQMIVVPPGRHTIRFHCRPAKTFVPHDSTKATYIMYNYKPSVVE